jgi:hypothetical protein
MTATKSHFLRATLTPLAAAALLAACGGGGSSSSNDPAAASGALRLSGTAATGSAIAGATVEARCASGSASGVTAADGTYTLSVSNGQLPCVARVTAPGGTVLHTVLAGSGTTAVGNLTPATQLIVARLAAADPAAYYAIFGAASAASATPATVAAAQTAVVETLKAAAVDFSAIPDLVGGTLKAKTANSAGDAYDGLLDQLQAALADSGTTLATLTGAMVTETAVGRDGRPPESGVATLPTESLLRPAAANCSAFRSGRYTFIAPDSNSALSDQTGSITIDVRTLGVNFGDGNTGTLGVAGNCHYLDDNGKTHIYVTQAGILVWRYVDDTGVNFRLAIAVPEQHHTLAELAGTWNLLGLERNNANSAYTGVAGTLTLNASGQQTPVLWCQNDSTWGLRGSDCATPTGAAASLRVNAAGGFDFVDAGATVATARAYVFRAGNGELMLMKVDADGSLQLRTRQRSNPLPTVGTVTTSWNVYVGNQGLANPSFDASSNTISSVDAASGSFVRAQTTVGSNNTHPETLFVNNPRDGYSWRQPGATTTTSGAAVTVSELNSLTLRGMGFTPFVLPGSKWFGVSVVQP